MDDATLERLLRKFGLSEKEVDTYLTILDHGEAKASTIADDAGVSKRYVYSLSERLEERGFVEVDDHVTPTTIRANAPDAVIDRLEEDLDAIEPALEARYSRTAPTAQLFEVVKSRVTVVKRITELLDAAEEEVTLTVPSRHLDEVRDALADAVDRGVLVLLVVTGVDPADLDETGLASATRAWSQPMPTILTVDRSRGLLAPTEMLERANTDQQAIAFTQPQLVPVLVGSFLANYWPMATETAVAEPAPLPFTGRNVRRVAFQATLRLRADERIRAHVTGRPVGSDDEIEVVGEVVEVRQGLLDPPTNTAPIEHALVLETDDGTVTVGGEGAFVEDVEAISVTLEAAG